MDKEVKEFCSKYNAYVQPSSRMMRRHRRTPFSMWKEDPEIFQNIPYEEIKCVEVHMPEDRFRALIEHDEWLYKSQMSGYIVGNEAVDIVEQHRREVRIRHENPAAKIAYEKYQMILAMVDSHYD
jgi:hypothetical protein